MENNNKKLVFNNISQDLKNNSNMERGRKLNIENNKSRSKAPRKIKNNNEDNEEIKENLNLIIESKKKNEKKNKINKKSNDENRFKSGKFAGKTYDEIINDKTDLDFLTKSKHVAYKNFNKYYKAHLNAETNEIVEFVNNNKNIVKKAIKESETREKLKEWKFINSIYDTQENDYVHDRFIRKSEYNGEILFITSNLIPIEIDISDEKQMNEIVELILNEVNEILQNNNNFDVGIFHLTVIFGSEIKTISLDAKNITYENINKKIIEEINKFYFAYDKDEVTQEIKLISITLKKNISN